MLKSEPMEQSEMQKVDVRNTIGLLAVALLHGCAITDGENIASTAAFNSSYVQSSTDGIVKHSQAECVRTSTWDSANGKSECNDAPAVAAKTTPKPAKPTPPPKVPGTALVTFNGRALFEFDSSALTAAGRGELDQLTAKLNEQDEITAIEIVGHADSIGSEAYNQKLSENRAESVKTYLQRSLRTVKVSSTGMGESAPVADNNTEAGRQLNRRVDVNIAAITEK